VQALPLNGAGLVLVNGDFDIDLSCAAIDPHADMFGLDRNLTRDGR
jgi:hypothetical protein